MYTYIIYSWYTIVSWDFPWSSCRKLNSWNYDSVSLVGHHVSSLLRHRRTARVLDLLIITWSVDLGTHTSIFQDTNDTWTMKQCDNTNEKEKTIMKLVNFSYSLLTPYGSWSCDEKIVLPSLAHELLVTWLPTLCWYNKVTAGVEKNGTCLIVPRDFHDFQIVRYVSQKNKWHLHEHTGKKRGIAALRARKKLGFLADVENQSA